MLVCAGPVVIPSRWRIIWWIYRLAPSLGLQLGAWDHQIYLDTAKRAVAHQPSNEGKM
jgi:hypothetical protein